MSLLEAETTTLQIVNQHLAAVHNFAKAPSDPDAWSAVFLTAGMLAGQALLCERLVQERNDRIAQLEHSLAMLIERAEARNNDRAVARKNDT